MTSHSHPRVFEGILVLDRRPHLRRLGGSTLLAILVCATLLVGALGLSGHKARVAAKPRTDLVVTLLDPPRVTADLTQGDAASAPGLASPTHGVEAPLAAVTRGATQRSSSPSPGAPKPTKNNMAAAALSLPSDTPRSQETKPGAPILDADAVTQQQPSAAATPGPDQPQSAAATIAAKPGVDSSAARANATGGSIDGTGQSAVRGTGSGSNIGSGTGSGKGGANSGESTVLPFMDGMTRPQLLSMIEPEYTREARDSNVKGLFVAKCVITTQGTLQRCRVVKGLPMMDQAVLAAISQWRYSPVVYQGKPVAVDYVIQVRLAGH